MSKTWLDRPVAIADLPKGVSVRLRGRVAQQVCYIWLAIIVNGNELRVPRYHSTIADESVVESRNKNKVNFFIEKYAGYSWSNFKTLLDRWSINPTTKILLSQIKEVPRRAGGRR